MIAIATGMDALDKKIMSVFEEHGDKDLKIVNYREFLLKNDFDVVIMSNYLAGEIELELMLLELREKDCRVIYLTNPQKEEELRLCFRYNVYDIALDPIDPVEIHGLYKNPNKFKDIKKLFLQVNSKDGADKSIDLERLLEVKHLAGDEEEEHQDLEEERARREEEDKKAEELRLENERMRKENERLRKEEEAIKRQLKASKKANLESGHPETEVITEVVKETVKETVYEMPSDYKKVIVVMSPEATGKTTLAVNMAWNFSKNDVKTTLIDTDYIKKDIFFHFATECSNCMSKLAETDDVLSLGVNMNQHLKVFTEEKDKEVNLKKEDLTKLIVAAKKTSQVVIIDLSYELEEDTIKSVLDLADNVIVVVDQRVSTLNRVPEDLYKYKDNIHDISIVINRYYTLKHLEKNQIADVFFKNINVPGGKEYDYKIDGVFTLNDDAKSVLEGLSFSEPAIEKQGNYLKENIDEICSQYYMIKPKQKKKFGLFGK